MVAHGVWDSGEAFESHISDCRRVKRNYHASLISFAIVGSTPISAITWCVGRMVETQPFQGCYVGSNPTRITKGLVYSAEYQVKQPISR